MAFVRERSRKDGSVYFSATFRLGDGTQTSESYRTEAAAQKTIKLVEAVGGDRALDILGIVRKPPVEAGMTVTEWLYYYIDHLTGIDQGTLDKYRAYVVNDIDPILGDHALATLSREDVADWVLWMEKSGALNRDGSRRPASPKTIANKHGFFSAALAAAVPKHIAANPAADRRLPQGEALEAEDEMIFLSADEYGLLREQVPPFWKPQVEFLVASGCRWGEVAGLRPGDINRDAGTVRIRRSWTYSPSTGYRLVKPKGKSRRTINVPDKVLGQIDLSPDREWVFLNRAEGPVRIHGFHSRVWRPAVLRSRLDPTPRIHDLRHTCASWMIARGVPLPVIQRHLGHESITTTIGVYGHLDRGAYELAASAIDDALT